jgi:hypothetical protein
MDQIEAAIAVLHLQHGKDITSIENQFGLERIQLSYCFCRVTSSQENGYKSQHLLNTGQSLTLLKHINNLSEYSLPPTHATIQNIIFKIASQLPGQYWVFQ